MLKEPKDNDNIIFVIGIICLACSLGFLLFALYILPYLIWELDYNVPTLLANIMAILQDSYDYSKASSKIILWLIFFIPGLITGYLSYYISSLLDAKNN